MFGRGRGSFPSVLKEESTRQTNFNSDPPQGNFGTGRGRGRGGFSSLSTSNGPGHISDDGPPQGIFGGGRGRGGGRGGIEGRGNDRPCFKCNELGHISRDCPQDGHGFQQRNGFDGHGFQQRDGHGFQQRDGHGFQQRDGHGFQQRDGHGFQQRDGFDGRGFQQRDGFDGRGFQQRDGFDGRSFQQRGGFGGHGFQQRDDFGDRPTRPSFIPDARNVDDRPIRASFIPDTRNIDEIFKEDEDRENVADDLYQQDMPVIVEGIPANEVRVISSWEEARFSPQILENVKRSRFSQPRNFQKYAIPIVMDGHDIKGQAETGSGKSAAFLLPIINALQQSFEEDKDASRRCKVSALIIEPTRELAKQLFEQAQKFAHNTGVTANFAYGEYNMGVQKQSLANKGCDILVGTPGRLNHLFTDGFVKADGLQFLVLDEADRLLDHNFMDAVEAITKVPGFPTTEFRQTLFFSATFDGDVSRLAESICKKSSVIVKNTTSGVNTRIKQVIVHVPINDRKEYLLNMLKSEMASNNGVLPKKLIFVETKREADSTATLLTDEGIKAQTVNGDRPQQLREEATAKFRSGDFRALVVTNVFARGMNFTDLGEVINMQLPSERDTYVHRIGRTGRLNTGVATSFFDPDHQTDRDMAKILVEELQNSGQDVPDFVRKAASGDVFSSYNNYARFGGERNDYNHQSNSNTEQHFEIPEPEF